MEIFLYLLVLLLNLIIYYYYSKFPSFLKAYDIPINKIKRHKHPVPLSGGLAICITIISLLIIDDFKSYHNLILIFCLFTIFVIGFLDDLHLLSPIQRIVFLALILIIFIYLNPFFIIKEIKIYNQAINVNLALGIFLTIFSFLAVLNAFNFIDGIDGLSSFIFLSIFILCAFLDNYYNLTIIFLISSIVIYLFFNFSKKSFLGDGGIYILSSFLFFYLLESYQLNNLSLTQIVMMLSFPGIDLASVTVLRIMNKKKVYAGDRNHLHHLLFDCLGLKFSIFLIMLFFWIPNLLLNYLNLSFELIFIIFIVSYLILFNRLIKKRGLIFE